MKIQHRLTISYAFLLLFIAAIIAIAVLRFSQLSNQFEQVVQRDAAMVELTGKVNASAEGLAARLLSLFILDEQDQRKSIYTAIDKQNQIIDESIAKMTALTASAVDSPISKLITLRKSYHEAFSRTVDALEFGDADEAKAMMTGETRTTLDRMLKFTLELATKQQALLKERQTQTLNLSQESIFIVLLIGFAALIFGLVMSIFITRSIVNPLNKAVLVTDEISQGKLNINIQPSGKDEIGTLMSGMAKMREELHRVIGQIRNQAGKVSSTSGQMRNTADQVRKDSAAQSQMAGGINSSIEGLSHQASIVASTVQTTQEQAVQARDMANESVNVITHAASEITEISEIVASSADSVAHLAESAAEVAGAVNKIREIADQTNLLALNAAIEAARAGESGRGFAVVADEVRNLANRTNEVTSQIDHVIRSINEQTEQTANKISAGKTEMDRGAALIKNIIAPLQDLESNAQASVNSLEHLAGLADNQINENQSLAAHIRQIVDMAEGNRDSTEKLADLTDELLHVAQETEQTVSTFKLN